jgi:hypothetical protein
MTQTATELRQQAAAHEADARESFERCDTDGFLSQWASGINASVARKQASIVEAGGVATFERTLLVTLDGEATDARLVNTRYGKKWRLDGADLWLAYKPVRESTLAKRGYKETTVQEVAPAKAQTWAPPGATGLGGASSVQVLIFRTDDLEGGGRERNEWRCVGVGDVR